ncbi:MAG: zinc-ribbon domain-containing protein [Dehalococcoidia bacterium]|nr:MAG: zinc-ribbon domain-containing protein [Dehalococcoidia bacterium]
MQQSYQCPNCGTQVAFGVRFCTGCGTPMNWPTQQQMQPPPTYQQQAGHSPPWGGRTYQQILLYRGRCRHSDS